MKTRKSLWGILLSICMLISICNIEACAASGSLSVSSASGTVGSTVTVTGTVKASEAISAVTVTLTYSPSGLQYVGGSQDVTGGSGSVVFFGDVMGQNKSSVSFTMKFKILKEGSFSVSGIADGYTDAGMEQISISGGGGTITGKAQTTSSGGSGSGGSSGGSGGSGNTRPQQKDSNSKLNGLQVYPGTLSPAFSANTTSYTVNVTDMVKDVTITATAQSSKANVNVSGGKGIQVGNNAAKVVVTAEDGTTTVYNLTIVCEKVEKIPIGEIEHVVNTTFSDDQIPTGFVKESIKLGEKEYTGLSHEKGNLTLICMQDASSIDNPSVFYIYEEETNNFYPFMQIAIAEGKNIIPLPIYETKEFSQTTTLTVQDKTIEAWKIDEEFCVIPVLNAAGENVLYKFDSVDGTYQRYSEAVPEENEETDEIDETKPENKMQGLLSEYGLYMIAGLGAVVLILAVTLIYLLSTKGRKHLVRRKKKELDMRAEENDN